MGFMNLRQKKAELLREAILAEAIKILERDGVEKVTIRSIVESLGCSLGVIYNYFQDKDEILREIYVRTCRQFMQELQALPSKSSDRLEAFVHLACFICDFRIKNSRRYREIFLQQVFKSPPPELQQIRHFLQERLKALKLPGLPQDKDVENACAVILSLAEGAATLVLNNASKEMQKKQLETMKNGMRALIKGWSQGEKK